MPEVDGMQMSKIIKRMLAKMQSAQDNKDQILNSTVIEPYSDQNYTTRIFAITAMNDE
jgi:hypothetical protein